MTQINLLSYLIELFVLLVENFPILTDIWFLFFLAFFRIYRYFQKIFLRQFLVSISHIWVKELIHKFIKMVIFIHFFVELLLNLKNFQFVSVVSIGILFEELFFGNFLFLRHLFSSLKKLLLSTGKEDILTKKASNF